MPISKLTLTPPSPFDFENTAYSHGWVVLAPNTWDTEKLTVSRVQQLSTGQVVSLNIFGKDKKIAVHAESKNTLSAKEKNEIKIALSHMFRLDEDLSDFYALCKKKGGYWKKVTNGKGRLLRSPTVWEDLIKTIATTNIQWGGTKRICENLVNTLGDQGAFPTPQAVANYSAEGLVETVRMGYRGPYVYEIAQQVTRGELDLQTWLDPDIPTPDLKKRLLAIKGVGAYAAATMLMLLGRYDDLAIDSIYREFTGKKYFKGEYPGDKQAANLYDEWGQWKYLAYWFDIWQGVDESL